MAATPASSTRRWTRPWKNGTTPYFLRENVRGMQAETWHHVNGCRMWLIVERDTMTHEIKSVRPAHEGNAAALAAKPAGDES